MLYDLGKHVVRTSGEDFFVAPSADVIGRVHLGRDASVWFGAVLRADTDEITIGERSNIQDAAVLHVDPGAPAVLGREVTVGHSATVHGCRVGDGTLVGIGATVLSGAAVGRDCIVGAHALITEGREFPDRSLILGAPARRIREVSAAQLDELRRIAEHYAALGRRYRAELSARSA
jgi:carbonic anhydrase/acetyltransferase-like protein (isoleucine patch superfamily)